MDSISPKLSVAIAVYNEEDTLRECLAGVKDLAGEIVVVDGESTDQTVAIAESFGARVIKEVNRKNFHINKQIAIDACKGDWILQLDADERISTMLASEIKKVINDPAAVDAYYLKRRNYFLGRWMNKGGMYPDPVIRLFKKGKAALPQASVHELMTVTGTTKWLSSDLLHIADPTFSRYLMRSNRYTTLQAEDYLNDDVLRTDALGIISNMIFRPLVRFLEIYFRHKGFQDGFPGFVFAYYSGLHLASSYVKYYEKKLTKTTFELKKDWS